MSISSISGYSAAGVYSVGGSSTIQEEATQLSIWQTTLQQDLMRLENDKSKADLDKDMATYTKDLQGALLYVNSLKKKYAGYKGIQDILDQIVDKFNGINHQVSQVSDILNQMFKDQGRLASDQKGIQHFTDEINTLQKEYDAASSDHDKQNKIFNNAGREEDKELAIINNPKSTPKEVAAAKKAFAISQAKATKALAKEKDDTTTMEDTTYKIKSDQGIVSNLQVEVSEYDTKINSELEKAQSILSSAFSDLNDETLIDKFQEVDG